MGSQTRRESSPSLPAPISDRAGDASLSDLRFRALLSGEDWTRLPPAVRQRFSKRLADGRTATYVGKIVKASFSRLGWLLAQAARLIGSPLPISRDTDVPTIVTVTEDMATGGQIWTRIYTRRNAFPQVVQSSKLFTGSTGLEEYIGFGISIALTVVVQDNGLAFRSAGYRLRIGRICLTLPAWAAPGALTVTHEDLDNGEFLFALELRHPRFGLLIDQAGVFREATP